MRDWSGINPKFANAMGVNERKRAGSGATPTSAGGNTGAGLAGGAAGPSSSLGFAAAANPAGSILNRAGAAAGALLQQRPGSASGGPSTLGRPGSAQQVAAGGVFGNAQRGALGRDRTPEPSTTRLNAYGIAKENRTQSVKIVRAMQQPINGMLHLPGMPFPSPRRMA